MNISNQQLIGHIELVKIDMANKCDGCFAVDSLGIHCDPFESRAVRWCMRGSSYRHAGLTKDMTEFQVSWGSYGEKTTTELPIHYAFMESAKSLLVETTLYEDSHVANFSNNHTPDELVAFLDKLIGVVNSAN